MIRLASVSLLTLALLGLAGTVQAQSYTPPAGLNIYETAVPGDEVFDRKDRTISIRR